MPRKIWLKMTLIATTVFLLCSHCGKKSSDERGSGDGVTSYVPAEWAGDADYPNARWDITTAK